MNKKKFKFNVTDLLIILVLVAAVAVLAYIFVFSDSTQNAGEAHTVHYTLEITPINGELFSDTIKKGDTVTLASDREKVLGEVIDLRIDPTISVVYDEESGEEVYPEREGIIDITVTFKADTHKHDWGYAIGEDETIILVNDSINVLIGEMQCVAQCIELKVID